MRQWRVKPDSIHINTYEREGTFVTGLCKARESKTKYSGD